METTDLNLQTKQELSPLPFTYQKVVSPENADYKIRRVPGTLLSTDQQLLDSIKRQQNDKEWFTHDSWRERGLPTEQIELVVGDKNITIYNFNKEVDLTDEHIETTLTVLQTMIAHFPQIAENLRWILIDQSKATKHGDPGKYPLNGDTYSGWKMFVLYPRGMEFFPHRIKSATNIEGTLTHELTHTVQGIFQKEWSEKFKWEWCRDYPNDWESRPTPDGKENIFYNKVTGEMAPLDRFPIQPEQCVTEYAKLSEDEDICESMVAYIYDPSLLQEKSLDKFNIILSKDAQGKKPDVGFRRIPKDSIRLPEIQPKTVTYYIKEPETK